MHEKGSIHKENVRPELYEDLEKPWNIFNRLHQARQNNEMGANPISLSEIIIYLDFFDFDSETKEEYFYLISALDDCWIDWARKKVK